jgi:hypothetical protein
VSPDFVKLAEAYGAFGVRATRPDELSDVLSAGLSHKGVAVMDIVVSKEENVFPIVPAGGNSRDMIVHAKESRGISEFGLRISELKRENLAADYADDTRICKKRDRERKRTSHGD